MKVCHVCSNYDKFFVDLMEEQILKEIDLRVYYFRAKERGMPEVKAPYLDIRLNYSNWDRPFFYLKEGKIIKDFFNIYKREQFDIIHAHTLFSNGYVALKAKKEWGIPYIVAVRDMDLNIFLKYRINLRKLGIEILKEAERIIFISDQYKKQLVDKYVPSNLKEEFLNKSLIIPNGINEFYLNNIWNKSPKKIEKEINVITVGYISKRKNQLSVCEAIKMLNDSGIKVKYTVVGNILDKKIFDKIKEYSFVTYIPFLTREELIDEYRKADIFVMPSITETFGLTYVEAMSQGLPVIYSKGQGFDGRFKEGHIGYHVRSKDTKDIANKIIGITKNYKTISENCTKESLLFNWNEISTEYKEIYKDILHNKK